MHARTSSQKDRSQSVDTSSSPTMIPPSASQMTSEAVYLHQKLLDVLAKQIAIDEKHQQELILSRHQLRRLYDENASYRSIITAAEYRKRNDGRVASSADSASVTDAELAMFFARCTLAKRNQNRLKYELNRLEQIVAEDEKKYRNNMKAVELSSHALDHVALDMKLSGTPSVGIRTKKIEDELNAVLGQQQVVEMVTKKYRDQIGNFANDRFQYANHIKALEHQYLDRHREHLQMVTLFQNATYDYEKMVSQRAAFTEHLKKQRKLKEKLLQDRQTEVKHAIMEGERYVRGIADLQMEFDEESQLLERVEMEHQELLKRQSRQHDTDTILGSGKSGSRRSSPRSDSSPPEDAELEEQLSAYRLANQYLLKETKRETMADLIPFFQKEISQFDQLRSQVAVKLNRKNVLEEEVKRLRATYNNAKVCASVTGPAAPQSSSILEAEMESFLEEAEAQMGKLVREGESHRVLLQELAEYGNHLSRLTSGYRPEIHIQPMKEEDSLLPIHFTALTQKLLSLADEATAGTRGVAEDQSHPHQGGGTILPGTIPLPPVVTPVVIPENNLRVSVKQRNGDNNLGRRPPRKGGRRGPNKPPTATMTSVGCNPSLLQHHRGGQLYNNGGTDHGSGFSFLSADDSAVLMTEGCEDTKRSTVSSDMDDDEDSFSSSRSSSLLDGNRRGGGGMTVADSYLSNSAASHGVSRSTSSVSLSSLRRSHLPGRLHGKKRADCESSATGDYNDVRSRRGGGGGALRSCSSSAGFGYYPSPPGGRNPRSRSRGRGGSIASDTPLRREELKRVSWAIKKRETKRLAHEERRRAGIGKNM